MNHYALMLLDWIRTDETEYMRGITRGYFMAKEYEFEPWERQYILNVMNAYKKGQRL